MQGYFSKGKVFIPNVSGNIVITANAVQSAPAFKNQILTSIDANGNIVGLLLNHRYNSSDILVEYDGTDCCGFIPCKKDDVIRLSGINFGETQNGAVYLRSYNSNFSQFGYQINPYVLMSEGYPAEYRTASGVYWKNIIYDAKHNVLSITQNQDSAYIRIAWFHASDNPIITINEEII